MARSKFIRGWKTSDRNGSFTKKGPGRYHVQGKKRDTYQTPVNIQSGPPSKGSVKTYHGNSTF